MTSERAMGSRWVTTRLIVCGTGLSECAAPTYCPDFGRDCQLWQHGEEVGEGGSKNMSWLVSLVSIVC